MAASGFTPIILFNSTTAGNTPTTGNLAVGELAINAADGKLYYNTGSAIKVLAGAGGAGIAGGSNTQVQFNSSGNLAGASTFTWSGTALTAPQYIATATITGATNQAPFNYGTLSFTDVNIFASMQSSVNNYNQFAIQNTSNGTAASAGYVAYNDGGTATTNFMTVGINSSGYSGTGSIGAAGYGYLLSASTDMVIGTIGANGIHFTTNSSATDALAISSAGAVSLPGGTANGVAYLNGSKVLTTGSALTFDGTNLGVSGNGTFNTGASGGITSGSATYSGYFSALGGGSGATWSVVPNTISGANGVIYNTSFVAGGAGPHIFSIGGSEQMRLTSTGLGIGTNSPSVKLQVYNSGGGTTSRFQTGTTANGNFIDFYNAAGTRQGYLGTVDASGNFYLHNDANASLYFDTNNTTNMTLNGSGNLGLGVTPSAWDSGQKVLQISNGAFYAYSSGTSMLQNAYYNSGFKYIASSTAAAYYTQIAGQHQWYYAPSGTAGNAISFTQAMTLDNSGNLLVGTTSASGNNSNAVFFQPANGAGYFLHASGTSSGTEYAKFFYNGNTIGSITQSGTTAVLYNLTSDQRLKENIVDAPEFGSVIDSIQVRSYDWKADHTHQRAGFIAQELVTVVPEAVHQPSDQEQMMGVDYSKLVPMLVKEIQSLRARLKAANIA